jgi:hypothetical protein
MHDEGLRHNQTVAVERTCCCLLPLRQRPDVLQHDHSAGKHGFKLCGNVPFFVRCFCLGVRLAQLGIRVTVDIHLLGRRKGTCHDGESGSTR